MAVSVCLAMAFSPLMADRGDRTADRTKTVERGPSDDATMTTPSVILETKQPLQLRSATSTSRADSMMALAAQAENNDQAVSALMQALSMGPEDEKLLAEAYTQLGDLYDVSSKQLHFYGLALQYESDPGARARLQRQITDLGGDVFNFAMQPAAANSYSTKTVGYADSCDESVPLVLDAYVTGLTIQNNYPISSDHDWFSFDVPGPDGWAVMIETHSDDPPYVDDTDLTLWAGCDAGVPQGQLAFNDDGGVGFMSLIQTDCLAPGTYYIEVGGFFNLSNPDNFDLEVIVTEVCILPSPDSYEPDDLKATANDIGFATAIPLHANGWGRAKTEIQDHTIFPPFDLDHVQMDTNKDMLIRMGTAIQFPTKFNGFEGISAGTDIDTYIELTYLDEPDYGGLCNDPAAGFDPYCREDADCPPPIGDPIPGLPTCMPLYFFSFSGQILFYPPELGTPLAYNEDKGWGDWGSELLECLPRGSWIMRALSSPAYAPSDVFLYQIQAKNEVNCPHETEWNGSFLSANPIELGETWFGIEDYAVGFGTAGQYWPEWQYSEDDLYQFDVETTSLMIFETFGYNIYNCDTTIYLYVGPDDDGFYYYTGVMDDDSGPGWLSLLGVIAPPASDLLGNMAADADYFLDVSSLWLNPNFPYGLATYAEVYVPPTFEVEPNDTCATGNAVASGDVVVAAINPTCDYDAFTFELTEAAYVTLETGGASGDTTMILETAGGDYLGCDDDGADTGLWSKIEGCLPAGSYCARVRAYSGYSTISEYEMSFSAAAGCMPTDPPDMDYDGLYRCDGFGYDDAQDEFNTCPN
jgi:hypothetical protein